MINRDLIRRKIVQLTYAYYQNSDHNMENAEKELMFSLSKSYDLYNYMLQLIVAITQEALRCRCGSCQERGWAGTFTTFRIQ